MDSPLHNRIREVLGQEWMKSDVGELQAEAILTSLWNGNLVIVRKKEGHAPSTKVVPARRKRLQ